MKLGPFGARQRQSQDLLRPHRTAVHWSLMEDSKGILPGEASVGAKRTSLAPTSISTPAEKHSGTRSARIAFDGTQNLAYQNLYQMMLVAPGTRYRFRGFLRTDHISTDSGMRFEIFDPHRTKNLDVLTPNETGTQPWTLEEAEFTTGPQTHLIRIRLRRLPSTRLDNKLSGTVWVDDVAVLPAGSTQ